jgi:hypothetical protein
MKITIDDKQKTIQFHFNEMITVGEFETWILNNKHLEDYTILPNIEVQYIPYYPYYSQTPFCQDFDSSKENSVAMSYDFKIEN